MLFTSYEFIGFLLILLVLYYAVPKKMQAPLLLAADYLFYAANDVRYVFFLAASTVTVWFAARKIGENIASSKEYIRLHKDELTQEEKKSFKKRQEKIRFRFFLAALLLNLLILGVVKYTDFFIRNINRISMASGKGLSLSELHLLLPLGISFYTFQSLGYLIDVYREAVPPQKRLWKYALFVSFFPLLIQGPISRYKDLSETLYGEHPFDGRSFSRGLERILWGYFKKLVIADRLLIGVNTLISAPADYQGGYVFWGMLFYTLELYADFTGGIDITIGVSECLGIRVMENFNLPYFSSSLAEYWRRWHISMCSWFRDYVFYPVSTSRALQNFSKWSRKHFGKNIGRRLPVYVSSFVVWLCTGIWHGASFNFIIWGLLNFAVLMISEELNPLYERFHKRFPWSNSRIYHAFCVIRTFLLICVMNLFDCFESAGDTVKLLLSMFSPGKWTSMKKSALLQIGLGVQDYVIIILGLMVVFTVSLIRSKGDIDVRTKIGTLSYPVRFLLWFLLFLSVLITGIYGIGYDSSQFIYNRF